MSVSDQQSRCEKPTQSCDIVMKGGITSGVVYPLALVALAKKYRFSNIGGTSAGAIAAAAAAAAEYGRPIEKAGFDRLAKIPDEIGPNLLALFQPTPLLKPLFDIFVAALGEKTSSARMIAIIKAAVTGYWLSALLGVLPGVIVAVVALLSASAGFVAFGLLLALVGLVVAIIRRLLKAANVDLVANDFGLCPGIHQPGSAAEAFTDWLSRLIKEAAGRGKEDPPLTFGDLAAPPNGAPPIQLAMITTSLMEGRPYTLPLLGDSGFVFEQSEGDKLFPSAVMSYLVNACERFMPLAGEPGEYYHFPSQAKLPLIVGARMSLSFPGLISAVPLWRRDYTLTEQAEKSKLRRCLFSDGGLSSNFPIHFFDHLMPNGATFAITLDEYDTKGNPNNVWLPSPSSSGSRIPIRSFDGLSGFLWRLFASAKDWQDTLQSTLPGYRERIAHVVLRPEEGGLNLTMDEATIRKLASYGEQAGLMLRDEFDLDANRWWRFLVSLARMEETLEEIAQAYEQAPGRFGDFLDRYAQHPVSYKQDTPQRVEAMLARAAELVALGKEWRTKPTIRDGNIPKPPTHLRITPKY
jgi:predicted acylesterase/phospholipase RssA